MFFTREAVCFFPEITLSSFRCSAFRSIKADQAAVSVPGVRPVDQGLFTVPGAPDASHSKYGEGNDHDGNDRVHQAVGEFALANGSLLAGTYGRFFRLSSEFENSVIFFEYQVNLRYTQGIFFVDCTERWSEPLLGTVFLGLHHVANS